MPDSSLGQSGRPPYWRGEAWEYHTVPRWRRLVCGVIGHRWSFIVGKRPSGGDRYACGRCGSLEKVGW